MFCFRCLEAYVVVHFGFCLILFWYWFIWLFTIVLICCVFVLVNWLLCYPTDTTWGYLCRATGCFSMPLPRIWSSLLGCSFVGVRYLCFHSWSFILQMPVSDATIFVVGCRILFTALSILVRSIMERLMVVSLIVISRDKLWSYSSLDFNFEYVLTLI